VRTHRLDAATTTTLYREKAQDKENTNNSHLLRLMPHRAAPYPRILELHHKLLVQAITKILCGRCVIVKHHRSCEVCCHSLRLKDGAVEEIRVRTHG
jgi:hypothetical protein